MNSYCGNNTNLNFLCLDLSLDRTGWSVFIKGTLVEYGNVDCNSSKISHVERLMCIRDSITEVLDNYVLDCVIIEDVHYSKNIDTYKRLCELRGLILAASYEYVGNDIFIFPTAHPRSCFMLDESTKIKSKEDAFAYISKLFPNDNFNFKDHNDICDSIILGLSFMEQTKHINTKKLVSKQKEYEFDIGEHLFKQHWTDNISIKKLAGEFKVSEKILLSWFNCYKIPTRS